MTMDITYRNDDGILEVSPTAALAERDFQDVAAVISSIQEKNQDLTGVLIYTKEFPGYDTFSDLLAHGKFIRDQSGKIKKVAFCTDSTVGKLLELIGKHLTGAEAKRFDYDQKQRAEQWLRNNR